MALMLEKCPLHLVLSQMHASLCSHVYIAPALGQSSECLCCSLQIKSLHRLFVPSAESNSQHHLVKKKTKLHLSVSIP